MVFITGASGLVGNHLLHTLLNKKIPVKVLYHQTPVTIDKKYNSLVEFVEGNVLDVTSLENALQNVTQVYHCAAVVSFSGKHVNDLYQVNVTGTANVVNAALDAHVQKLVHVSSVAALGRASTQELITETTPFANTKTDTPYAKSKHLAELEVYRGIAEGLHAVMVLPSIILGESDWNKSSTAMFKTAYEAFPWYTLGSNGFVDVDDLVKAMMLLMNDDAVTGEKFIISGHNKTYKEVFTLIAQAFGTEAPHKLATPFLTELTWRTAALKAALTGKASLLTKQTARTAQKQIAYNNNKFLQKHPEFFYTPIEQTITRVAQALQQKLNN